MNIDRLMDLAKATAKNSPNRSRKTACVIVLEDGTEIAECNTFPPGIADKDERHEGEARYRWIEHAERGALYHAARNGLATRGATIVVPWFPCVECSRAIVGGGLTRIHCVAPDWTEERYHFRDSETILREGGVAIEYYKEENK